MEIVREGGRYWIKHDDGKVGRYSFKSLEQAKGRIKNLTSLPKGRGLKRREKWREWLSE